MLPNTQPILTIRYLSLFVKLNLDILPRMNSGDSDIPPFGQIVVSTRVACDRKSDTLSSKG